MSINFSNFKKTDPAIRNAKRLKSEHKKLISSMSEHKIIQGLLDMTLTLDQAKVVLTMLESIRNYSSNSSFDPNDVTQSMYDFFMKF